MLLQDYEELLRKHNKNTDQLEDHKDQEKLAFEDEGLARFSSSGEDTFQQEASSRGKDLFEDSAVEHMGEVGKKLVVSVHHFPMVLCPFSPRVFVLPSEGSVAEASISAEHEDSLSPGLPPISSGLVSDGDDVPPGATLTAHFLYYLASKVI